MKAQLDDLEWTAEDRGDNGQCDYLDGFHFAPEEMRRLIDSFRATLAAYEDAINGALDYAMVGALESIVRHAAAIWNDEADYRQEWAPQP